jgi:Spy/CpxP family protein refolding chaperone
MEGIVMRYNHLSKLATFIAVMGILTLMNNSIGFAQRSRISLDERVKYLTEQLSLTQSQVESIRSIYQNAEKDRTAAFEANRNDRTAVRETVGKIMKEADDKVGALLTAEQKVKYEQVKKDRPRMMMGAPQPKKNKDKNETN